MFKIYKITNRRNGKIYIGQTSKSIEQRFMQHTYAPTPLGDAMRAAISEDKLADTFTIEVIEECETAELARERERFWIKVLNCKQPNGYNRSNGGERAFLKNNTKDTCGMSIGDRIAIIIKQNGLKKVEFAAKVNIDQSYVTKIIKGISNASPRLLDDICRKFDVRREWLEQGEGAMFEHRDKTILEQLAAEYKLTPKSRELIENFLSLSPENQQMVISAFENAARLVQPKVARKPKPATVKELDAMMQKELSEIAEKQLKP